MPAANAKIAERFKRFADLLEIEDANPVRAHRNATRVAAGYSRGMAERVTEGRERPQALVGPWPETHQTAVSGPEDHG